jgi:GntR family histidine utilization transcriptional repressor
MQKYREIRDTLLERITGGEWRPGERIPDEVELARDFGVTRPTVGRALRELAEAGLIERRRRAGTRVALRTARDARLTIPIVREEIEGRGAAYRYELIDRSVTTGPSHVRATLGLGPRGKLLHVRCLHLADGRPWQVEDRWISLDAVPKAKEAPFERLSPNEWLVGEVPYTTAEHVLSAGRPDDAGADLLALAPGEPVFVIERTTWLGARGVTFVRLLHPGDSFSLATRMDAPFPEG